jgi:L-amino acid N-acyltransferase YncA
MRISESLRENRAGISALLSTEQLPLAGLDTDQSQHFVAIDKDQQLVGVIGLERFGTIGLLRSLCVEKSRRRQGIGQSLSTYLENHARSLGLQSIFLLTETAAPYFQKQGFQPLSRALVPAPILASAELQGTCPSSALVMKKNLEFGSQTTASGAVLRPATRQDAEAIARIYNQGIDDRIATFETIPRTAQDILSWFDGVHSIVVLCSHDQPLAFAATSSYRPRACYAGIAEYSVYVDRSHRGRGYGYEVMEGLLTAAAAAGCWKVLSRIFVENEGSRSLMRKLGFREVGTYEKHGRLDEKWRDVVVVEKLL